ncbi:putative hemolysin [Pantoea vagans]
MRNPASQWCMQRGGQQVKDESLSTSTLYCLLPSGERIEQWALYHRDHPQ